MAHFWKWPISENVTIGYAKKIFELFLCHYGVLRKIQYSVVNTWIRTRSAFSIQFWILNLFSRLQKVHFHSKIYKISSKFGNYFSRNWPEIGSKRPENGPELAPNIYEIKRNVHLSSKILALFWLENMSGINRMCHFCRNWPFLIKFPTHPKLTTKSKGCELIYYRGVFV